LPGWPTECWRHHGGGSSSPAARDENAESDDGGTRFDERYEKIGLRENPFEYDALTFSPDERYLAACRRVASRDQDRINYPYRIKPMDTPVEVYCRDGTFKRRLPGCIGETHANEER
jgi:hypothetical protein